LITVIIPTINEESTIARVVNFAKKNKDVSEIIVVDDKSIDNTVKLAEQAGAKVITSTKIGKGASMLDGLSFTSNQIVVFLDGDIDPYPKNTIKRLTDPIKNNEADFVKSSFSRQAGRVTELVAKPLLGLMFPRLMEFNQPLSGIIAGKKEVFQKLSFENDYGVDIGILIDAHISGLKIKEVFIGNISNKMKPWNELGKMSAEVSKTIISRAIRYSNELVNLDSLQTIKVIRDQMESSIKDSLKKIKKMIIFDMDRTISKGSFIETASKKFKFEKELLEIVSSNNEPILITKKIATLLKGLTYADLLKTAEEIPINEDIIDVIPELKKRGYMVGIITDSYDFVANYMKNRISADFCLANELEFSNSIATGEVKIPSFFIKSPENPCTHNYCKSNALISLTKQYNISLHNVISVGDGENDICMIKMSGIGVAYKSQNKILIASSDKTIKNSFFELLEYAL
jgi:glucosyl-3-phosphoglycerate synthase